jgi:hypothetical protein
MNAIRLASAVLAGVSLMTLTACGDATDTAAPAATTATVPAATTPAVEATTAPPAEAKADKEVCEDAHKAAESLKKATVVLARSGTEISAADAKAMLTDFANSLAKATEGGDPKLTAAVRANVDAALAAAAAPDPMTSADTPEAAKAGKDLNALCKAAGVKTAF